MRKPLYLITVAAALAAAPALAQNVDPGAAQPQDQPSQIEMDPAAVEPAAGQDRKDHKAMGPVTTEVFVAKAAKSGRFEVESSELAAEKTENAEVSAFARQMINDHNKANERLQELAQSVDNAPDQTEPDAKAAKYKEKMDKLNAASGSDFDRQYMEMQVAAHKKAVELFRNYAQNGDDVGLKGFAQDTLPTLERHLDQAQRLHQALR